LNLIPTPQSLQRLAGSCRLPDSVSLQFDPSLPRDTVVLPLALRLKSQLQECGVSNADIGLSSKSLHSFAIDCVPANSKKKAGEYSLSVGKTGIHIIHGDLEGLRNAVATLRQLLREYGRTLPCLVIEDFPVFANRGVMLDISRGRVPTLNTLLELVDKLADYKINEFQLYLEHTFAYPGYEDVWKNWDPITSDEVVQLDAACRKLGIDLVPNQNSFGHLRYWLEHPSLSQLGENDKPMPALGGSFYRRPATLAPNHPGTLPFIHFLYDQLLPHFTSRKFNVGCDETFDLGQGQSRELCEKIGKGRVYFDFLKKIHGKVKSRELQMMFWGDIILNHPELVKELPGDAVALNWGYEASHPFEKETALFQDSGIPFYVCPGTSTWQTLVGRHDNALQNLQYAAEAGKRHSAIGYLNTDWGDGGHPQPLAVSWLPYLAGADAAWSGKVPSKSTLVRVLNRDIFCDPTGRAGAAALGMGLAHRKFKYTTFNATPYGATIAAGRRKDLEVYCREGLKYFARVTGKNVSAALEEINFQSANLKQSRPEGDSARGMVEDLQIAASLATESTEYLLWQLDLDEGKTAQAIRRAHRGIKALRQIKSRWLPAWKARNKGTPGKNWPFMDWRIEEYQGGKLPYSREESLQQPKVTSH